MWTFIIHKIVALKKIKHIAETTSTLVWLHSNHNKLNTIFIDQPHVILENNKAILNKKYNAWQITQATKAYPVLTFKNYKI